MSESQISAAEERIQWEMTPAQYETIRGLFLKHYEREQAGDVDGILETMSADCVYELPQSGQRFEGHQGARLFYSMLLGAFPNNSWQIDDIVIGPQGVLGVTTLTAQLARPFPPIGAAVGQTVRWRVVIMYPWDPGAEKFSGERVYYFQPEVQSGPTR